MKGSVCEEEGTRASSSPNSVGRIVRAISIIKCFLLCNRIDGTRYGTKWYVSKHNKIGQACFGELRDSSPSGNGGSFVSFDSLGSFDVTLAIRTTTAGGVSCVLENFASSRTFDKRLTSNSKNKIYCLKEDGDGRCPKSRMITSNDKRVLLNLSNTRRTMKRIRDICSRNRDLELPSDTPPNFCGFAREALEKRRSATFRFSIANCLARVSWVSFVDPSVFQTFLTETFCPTIITSITALKSFEIALITLSSRVVPATETSTATPRHGAQLSRRGFARNKIYLKRFNIENINRGRPPKGDI
ncbi:hypothetical protein V1478_012092 [Vespula squamosa]|uniref:Uncharacterized protein n=1 Tax=Vespula squamosa TaxID=30214 RepID=A0ABD2ACA9_VESSQ